MVSPVSGLFEMLKAAGSMAAPEDRDREPGGPFEIEIVGEQAGTIEGPSGLTISAQRSVGEVDQTDVVIVPSMALDEQVDWVPGRYPVMVAWIRAMHERGATVCSACSGGMLTAETGLLDGHQATIHWVSEAYFREREHDALRVALVRIVPSTCPSLRSHPAMRSCSMISVPSVPVISTRRG